MKLAKMQSLASPTGWLSDHRHSGYRKLPTSLCFCRLIYVTFNIVQHAQILLVLILVLIHLILNVYQLKNYEKFT